MIDHIANPDPEVYMGDNYLVLDFEVNTAHGDYGHPVHPANRLLLACWKRPGEAVQHCWGGEYEQEALLKAIDKADFIVAHNSKYELGWLRRCGLDLREVLPYCTQIGEYILAGNRAATDDKQGLPPIGLSLDHCARRRGYRGKDPVVDLMIKGGVNPVEIPRPWLRDRCVLDVKMTEFVFLSQREALRDTQRLGVALTRNIFTPVLVSMEHHGMMLDCDKVAAEWEMYTRQQAELEAQLEQIAGGINWNSTKQVAEFLYDTLGFDELRNKRGEPERTKAGGRKADKATLAALSSKAKTKEQKEFVRLKQKLAKVNAALSKNLDYFMGVCKEQGGKFHAEYQQTRTATGRLSSTGIRTHFDLFGGEKTAQMQNIPRIFKPLFKASREGWKIGEADGASIEFRGAGIVTGDPRVKADILGHTDIHKFTASVLNECDEEDVTGEQRQKAKADTFKPLYGGQSGSPSQQRYYKAFREKYASVAQTQAGWVEAVLADKVLVTPWGLRYYWPKASRSSSGYVNVTASVYNYPIQAFATAEVIPIAVTYFWHRLKEEGLDKYIKVVNTIHDSIICEIHPDYEEDFQRISKLAFGTDVYRYLDEVYSMDVAATGIPLGVGMKVGDHWSLGTEIKYDLFADGRAEQYE